MCLGLTLSSVSENSQPLLLHTYYFCIFSVFISCTSLSVCVFANFCILMLLVVVFHHFLLLCCNMYIFLLIEFLVKRILVKNVIL